jgi:hypothetical protein
MIVPSILEAARLPATTSSLDWPTLVVGAAASLAGIVALISGHAYRTREALAKLVERLDERQYFVYLWRMDQNTRPGREPWSIEEMQLRDLFAEKRAHRKIVTLRVLGDDWNSDRADMYEVYFFALRVHAWLAPKSLFTWAWRRTRLLSTTFSYQLLSVLLNHRIIACRLRRNKPLEYFPTQYGLFDPNYDELVRRLANHLLKKDRLHDDVRETLEKKKAAVDQHMENLKRHGDQPTSISA